MGCHGVKLHRSKFKVISVETNQIKSQLEDLQQRSEALRGYL
jgi:hypothetical protein